MSEKLSERMRRRTFRGCTDYADEAATLERQLAEALAEPHGTEWPDHKELQVIIDFIAARRKRILGEDK